MSKHLKILLVLFIGSIATAVIDQVLGVKFNEVHFVAQVVHKATYMTWGGIVLAMK